MSCATWQDAIALYIDGELPADERELFRAHAAECSACAMQVMAAMEAKEAVRRAGARYATPEALRERVASMARRATPSSAARPLAIASRQRSWTRWALAAAAMVSLAAGVALFVVREQRALGEFADLHVAALASANPVEVVSTDRHTVKPWFEGRIPFSFDVPEVQGTPFTLIGGRVAYFHQEPGAHLIFGYQKHRISVFVFRDTGPLGRATVTREAGFTEKTWTDGGLRYVVVSDTSAENVEQMAKLLRGEK